jgi:hypothetical protein
MNQQQIEFLSNVHTIIFDVGQGSVQHIEIQEVETDEDAGYIIRDNCDGVYKIEAGVIMILNHLDNTWENIVKLEYCTFLAEIQLPENLF